MTKKPDLDYITTEDLRSDERLSKLYLQAVVEKFWPNTPKDVGEFWCLAEKALADDTQGTPGKLFYSLIKANRTEYISNEQESRALQRMPGDQRHLLVEKAKSAIDKHSKQMTEGVVGGTVSQDARVIKNGTEVARHDRFHCLAPGLFRSLGPRERKAEKLDLEYKQGPYSIRFVGPEPLGAEDLRCLQGLIAMAGPKGLILEPKPQDENKRQLRLFLETKWDALEQDALIVKGGFRELMRLTGYQSTSGSLALVRRCIERLWSVSVFVKGGGERRGFRVLSEYASSDTKKQLYVALNPMIAAAALGGQHVRIYMSEVRGLQTNAGRLVHQRLCGWIDPGKAGQIGLDVLCGYVWPSVVEGATMRKRRQRAKSALEELRALKWVIREYEVNKFRIHRPKMPAEEMVG